GSVNLQVMPRALEDIALAHADAYPERMAAHLSHGDEKIFARAAVGVRERGIAVGGHVTREIGAVQVLAERKAPERTASARTNHTVAADHGNRAGRSEVDLVVEGGEVHGVHRRDHDAADAAVTLQEAPGELHRPGAAGAADD